MQVRCQPSRRGIGCLFNLAVGPLPSDGAKGWQACTSLVQTARLSGIEPGPWS